VRSKLHVFFRAERREEDEALLAAPEVAVPAAAAAPAADLEDASSLWCATDVFSLVLVVHAAASTCNG